MRFCLAISKFALVCRLRPDRVPNFYAETPVSRGVSTVDALKVLTTTFRDSVQRTLFFSNIPGKSFSAFDFGEERGGVDTVERTFSKGSKKSCAERQGSPSGFLP